MAHDARNLWRWNTIWWRIVKHPVHVFGHPNCNTYAYASRSTFGAGSFSDQRSPPKCCNLLAKRCLDATMPIPWKTRLCQSALDDIKCFQWMIRSRSIRKLEEENKRTEQQQKKEQRNANQHTFQPMWWHHQQQFPALDSYRLWISAWWFFSSQRCNKFVDPQHWDTFRIMRISPIPLRYLPNSWDHPHQHHHDRWWFFLARYRIFLSNSEPQTQRLSRIPYRSCRSHSVRWRGRKIRCVVLGPSLPPNIHMLFSCRPCLLIYRIRWSLRQPSGCVHSIWYTHVNMIQLILLFL